MPPKPAMRVVCTKSNCVHVPSSTSAGIVKMTPAASDSPALAHVCTMLFSRMFERGNRRRIPIEITAAGMEADTVRPANSPR
jgi:hypothetical protein